MMKQRTAVAVRHVAFEGLGSFAEPLVRQGYRIEYREATTEGFADVDAVAADLLVLLGGPVGAYESQLYPFLTGEMDLLERRLEAARPTLGICLGAQLIAQALGAAVYPGPRKEIGWTLVALMDAGRDGPLGALEGCPVLHWHGDTFDLPDGCDLLALTETCRNQAFARGGDVLALQFHAEVRARDFEQWLVGHACELAGASIDPRGLRVEASERGPALEQAAQTLMHRWLDGLP